MASIPDPLTLSPLTISPLRISTMVTTCHAGCGIKLQRLFESFPLWAIPFGYPGEGFLKMEYEKKVIGSSTRDILTKRKVTEKTFFNQATLVVRKKVSDERGYKEVNIKLFANGGIQMTGVPSTEFSQATIQYVIADIKAKDPEVFADNGVNAGMIKYRVQLINSDYSINRQIYQEKLHKILSNVYNLFSSHESTIYQGVNTKYYYNKQGNKLRPGICDCKSGCTGQGSGDGDGQRAQSRRRSDGASESFSGKAKTEKENSPERGRARTRSDRKGRALKTDDVSVGGIMIPLYDQVLASCRENWDKLEEKNDITAEWWLAFLGVIPEDSGNLEDAQLLALSIISLQEELKGYKNA